MTEQSRLIPVPADDVTDALAFALRFDGRKRTHAADELMARITAQRLVEHLERSGYIIMRRPPSGDLSRLQSGAKIEP
jgi:hypothetical protein